MNCVCLACVGDCNVDSYFSNGVCTIVPAGYYRCPGCFGNMLYVCPAGTYSPTVGGTACTPCPGLMISEPGATVCTEACPGGTYLTGGVCSLLPIGNYL